MGLAYDKQWLWDNASVPILGQFRMSSVSSNFSKNASLTHFLAVLAIKVLKLLYADAPSFPAKMTWQIFNIHIELSKIFFQVMPVYFVVIFSSYPISAGRLMALGLPNVLVSSFCKKMYIRNQCMHYLHIYTINSFPYSKHFNHK